MRNKGKALYLPDHPGGEDWGEKIRGFWRAVCEKPDLDIQPVDIPSLLRLFLLIDQFEKKPSKALAEEIRLHAKQFSLQDELEVI